MRRLVTLAALCLLSLACARPDDGANQDVYMWPGIGTLNPDAATQAGLALILVEHPDLDPDDFLHLDTSVVDNPGQGGHTPYIRVQFVHRVLTDYEGACDHYTYYSATIQPEESSQQSEVSSYEGVPVDEHGETACKLTGSNGQPDKSLLRKQAP